MILLSLVFCPVLSAALAVALPGVRGRMVCLVVGAVLHALLTVAAWLSPPPAMFAGSLALDSLGLVFLSIASALFLVCSLYASSYLPRMLHDPEATSRVAVPSLFLFLAAMTLTAESAHLGLLWVAIEATTLASAPLVAIDRTDRALEAMWKYLLVCSVGIALSLLGTFFLGIAFAHAGIEQRGLELGALTAMATHREAVDLSWFRAAFLCAVVGYGTKMGLAPMHTWLPDAHSEAPSPVSALLSGALLNCALLGVLRFYALAEAVGVGALAREVMLALGFASLAVAAGSLLAQRDYKRLLAYSSVENMGVVAVGVGIGRSASYGALLHAMNHSLAKAMLFLLAGNVLLAYRTKIATEVRGVGRELPRTGVLLLAALFAIGGLPPFGLFQSELTILAAALSSGRFVVGAVYLALLAIAFAAMAGALLPMTQGTRENVGPRPKEPWLLVGPPLALGAAVLVFGVYVPPALDRVLRSAAAALGTP